MPVYEEVAVDAPASTNGHGSDGIELVQHEIDDYLRRLKGLNALPSTEVFQTLSAISARLAEIRNRLIRVDNRRTTALRTKEVDPLIDEVDRQFKFHSRVVAMHQMEWDHSKGQT